MRTHRPLLCASLLVLAGFLQSMLFAGPIPSEKIPAFSIPRISKPPTIDGQIGLEEWQESTAVSGVANQADNVLFPRPTTFFLAWDREHLYWACRAWVMPGYKPRVNGRAPHTASVGDDGMELHFQPLGQNVAQGRTDSSYKFFVNCLGFCGEYVRVSVGQMFRNWMPEFRSAARMTEPGTAPKGGRWLEIEVAATARDFELAGPNRPGDQWKLMLGFNHMPIWMQARVPCNSGYFNPDAYCVGTLVENTPAVQALMEELPGPCDGVATVTFRAFNPTHQPVTLSIAAQFAALEKHGEVTVAPGKTAELRFHERLPDSLEEGHLYYQVTHAGRDLFRYYTFFKVGYPEGQMKYNPPEETFPFQATFNPTRFNLLLSVDAYYLDRPEDAKEVRYTVTKEGETAAVAEGTLSKPVLSRFSELVQLPELGKGSYTVESVLLTRDGKQLGPETRTFTKLDESKAFAEWWQKGLGSIERVIPPFKPMTRAGDEVTVWGRAYRLDKLGLPESIRSQGEEVLIAPSRVIAGVDGKEQTIPLQGDPKITESRPWRVRFEGKAKGAGLELSSRGFIEQDGLLRIELTYEPAKKSPVKVDSLRLEFPIADDQADCLLCLGTGGNYAARTTMLIPRKREGPLWSTFDTGRLGASMTVGSFYPCLWLGSERRGLLWWGDNDRGWVPVDDVPAHEVVRHGAEVILRNNIIGQPFELSEPRTITFGLMASPFRPLVKNWRSVLSSYDGTFSGGKSWGYKWREDPKTGKPYDGWNLLTPPSSDPEEWSTIWAEYKKKSDAKIRSELPFDPGRARNWMFVHTSLPLVGYGWKSPDGKVTGYFGPEWGNSECYTDANIDYYLHLMDRAFREGGLKTIYWDIFFPILHRSIQNGIAYQLPDGRVQPGYAGFNTRRFLMRSYALMHDHDLVPGSQVAHATNDYLLVASPWVDAILDGEYHKLTDESTMDWVDGYPVDRMRALSCPHNWGFAISWMDHIHIKDKEKQDRVRRGLIDYVSMYDSWKGPSHGAGPPLDINDERTEYIPFWRNPYVSGKDGDILVSMWRLPDRVLLCIFNADRAKTKSPTLVVDLDKLGLVPQLKWQEFVRVTGDATLDFHKRELTVKGLPPHSGKQIWIRRH